MNAPTAKLTLGRDAIRFVAGEIRRTILRSSILGFDRIGARAAMVYRTASEDGREALMSAEFDDTAEAQAIEDWLLDGMPGELQVASPEPVTPAKVNHAEEIGPGSIVEFLGQVYEVSREAHDGDVRRWRLNGYASRGVNESALRLVTPFRAGDRFEMASDFGPCYGRAAQYDREQRFWWIDLPEGQRGMVLDEAITHATRELPDGTVAVLR